MKKKLYTEAQINEILSKIATAILGGYTKGLLKVAEKDPKLHQAISAVADAKIALDDYVSAEYMLPDAESLSDNSKKNQLRLQKNLAKLAQRRKK
tara:strand:+ start:50745 stop:51029 length:285 start_codon:yes stop_codon:yes gene_type:complete